MASSIVYEVPEPKFAQMVQSSSNVSQVLEKLGGGAAQTAKRRMKELGLKLAEKNGHSSKKQSRQASSKKQSRQPRISESKPYSMMWGEGFPWPVAFSLLGVGALVFVIDWIARPDQASASVDQSSAIEELKTWINQVKDRNDKRYEDTKKAIEELKLKKIPSLAETREILSDITSQSNEFQAIANQAQARLNQTEARIIKLENNLEKALDAARQDGLEVSPGPTTGARVGWAMAGLLLGGIAGALVSLPFAKANEPSGTITGIGAVVGTLAGAIGAGWPIF